MKIKFRINMFSITYNTGIEYIYLNKYIPSHSLYHNLESNSNRYDNIIRGVLALLYN